MERTTIGATLDRIALGAGVREALVFADLDLRWSYRALYDHTIQVAKGLIGLGIDAGDHVAVWATNQPEWVLLQLAIAKIGAVLVTVNPAYRARELAYVLAQSDATALFMTDRFQGSDSLAILNESFPELARSSPGRLTTRRFPRLRRVASFGRSSAPGVLGWAEMLRAGAGITDHILRRREESIDPRDPVNVHYTSGTTGAPKGALLTHVNLLANATRVGACLRLKDSDRLCVPVPFYHGLGCVLGTLTAITHGATVVVPAAHFDAARTLTAIANEGCTVLHGTPAMFIAALEHPRFATFDLSSLRTGIIAGAPCPIEVLRQVVDRMHAREITIAYGQAEGSCVITQTRPEDPISLRASTVGRALPGVQVKIVDDEGREVPRGAQGELCCRGYLVMRGYYAMPEATAAAIDRWGWLHTGDLATMDEHGYCRITGRVADVVVRSGESIFPAEVEAWLHRHPAIADAQVFGVVDPVRGEELAACIRLVDGASVAEEDVRAYCANNVAHSKVPRYVRFVDDYPMTVTGTVQKFRLREQLERELGRGARAQPARSE